MPLGANRVEGGAGRRAGRARGDPDLADEGPAAVSETPRPDETSPSQDAVGNVPATTAARGRGRRGPARHVRPARTPATPPATTAWSARSRCRRRRSGRSAASSTPSPTRSPARSHAAGRRFDEAVEKIVVDRGEITFYVRRDAIARRPAGPCGTTPTCGSSCSPASAACTTRRTPAASCTPSTTCSRSRTTAGSGSRSPPRTPTRTSPRVVEVYPTADWHERETWDFFGIVFDGHPALDPHRDAGRLARPPAAQGLPAGRHRRGVQGRGHPAARHPEVVQLMSDQTRLDAVAPPTGRRRPPPDGARQSRRADD